MSVKRCVCWMYFHLGRIWQRWLHICQCRVERSPLPFWRSEAGAKPSLWDGVETHIHKWASVWGVRRGHDQCICSNGGEPCLSVSGCSMPHKDRRTHLFECVHYSQLVSWCSSVCVCRMEFKAGCGLNAHVFSLCAFFSPFFWCFIHIDRLTLKCAVA